MPIVASCILDKNAIAYAFTNIAGAMPICLDIPSDVFAKNLLDTLMSSPMTKKELGYYAMALPCPMPLYEPNSKFKEQAEVVGGLITDPDDGVPEGMYHGNIYIKLKNPDIRLDASGVITNEFSTSDVFIIGLENLVCVGPIQKIDIEPPKSFFGWRRVYKRLNKFVENFNKL